MPHKHANELGNIDQSQAFEEADGFIDYVKLLFLTDLGEGHMETFDQGENFDFASEFQIQSNPDFVPFTGILSTGNHVKVQSFQQDKLAPDIPFLRQYLLSHIDLRGPPVQV